MLIMGYLLAAAALASTFNLNCVGTFESLSEVGERSEPWEHTFRVDLEQGKWCGSECKALHDFADIGATQLTFQDKSESTPSGESRTSSYVNRETGEYRSLASSKDNWGIVVLTWQGQCEAEAFTGFPQFETKF